MVIDKASNGDTGMEGVKPSVLTRDPKMIEGLRKSSKLR